MSGVFFADLGLPEPDVNLHVGSGAHGEQTAAVIDGNCASTLPIRFPHAMPQRCYVVADS